MPVETDRDYFRRRATEERVAAEQAVDARARERHARLANAYERFAEEGYFVEHQKAAAAQQA